MYFGRNKPFLRQFLIAHSPGELRLPLFLSIVLAANSGLQCSRDRQLPLTVSDQVAQNVLNRTASISYEGSPRLLGTALVLDGSRLVTNNHVVDGRQDRIRVTMDGDRFFRAKVLRQDPGLDLALLDVDSEEFRPATDPSPIPLATPCAGLPIFSYGAAFGLHNSYFQGFISHPARTGILGSKEGLELVQIQGITFPGMSGAAIFSLDGAFVGLNRAAYGYAADTGTGLAIPGETVLEFVQ